MEVQSQFIEMFYNDNFICEKLKAHIEVIRGVSYKPTDVRDAKDKDSSVILRSNNIFNGLINYDDIVFVDSTRVSEAQELSKGDIVMCGSNGSKNLVGKAAMITEAPLHKTSFGAFCLGIRCKDTIHPKYLSSYFQTSIYRNKIEELGAGSNILNIKPDYINNMEIPVPRIEQQLKFVSIAEQADKSKFVGFKSQFIEMFKNLPVNGVIKDLTVGNIASVKKSYSKEDIINYIDISSIDNTTKTIVETSEHIVTKAPSRAQQCVQKGDILVSTVRPINRNIAVIEEDTSHLVASTGFCILRPQEGYKEYLLSIVLSDTYTEKMCDKANGGLYPAVNNSDVLNYGIHIPDEDTAKKVSALYQQSDKSKLLHRKSIKYSKYSL